MSLFTHRIRTPVVLQMSQTECGVAVLSSMMSYHGLNVPMETLRDQCGHSRDGCSASTMVRVAESYGLISEVYQITPENLQKINRPVIAFWKGSHYVIINHFKNNRAHVNDPAKGEYYVSHSDFMELFSGVMMLCVPGSGFEKVAKKKLGFAWAGLSLSKYIKEFSALALCMIYSLIWPISLSILAKMFVDGFVGTLNCIWLLACLIFTFVAGFGYVTNYIIQRHFEFCFFIRSSLYASMKIFLHSLRLPILFYSLRHKTELIVLFIRSEYVVSVFYKNLTSILSHMIMVLGVVSAMLWINYAIAIYSLCLNLSSALVLYCIAKKNILYEKRLLQSSSHLYSHTLSTIKNIESVKASGLEHHVLKKWIDLLSNKVSILNSQAIIASLYACMSRTINCVSLTILICLVSNLIIRNDISNGVLLALFMLHSLAYNFILKVIQAIKELVDASVSLDRLNDVMSIDIDPMFNLNYSLIDYRQNNNIALELKSVSFKYGSYSNSVINRLSFGILRGSHIAFVGASGCGKSTIAKLCASLYKPTDGEMMLFGKVADQYSSHDLASMVAYLNQDSKLFSGTVYQNITFGCNNVTQDDVNKVIKSCCLSKFTKLHGLQGYVAENGSNLSGGEIQRINLARTLLQKSSLIILDESTSALDPETEAIIIQNLRMTGKTIIFIAHRLQSIKHCDQIYVMDRGVVVEQGVHASLIALKGRYYNYLNNEFSEDYSIAV